MICMNIIHSVQSEYYYFYFDVFLIIIRMTGTKNSKMLIKHIDRIYFSRNCLINKQQYCISSLCINLLQKYINSFERNHQREAYAGFESWLHRLSGRFFCRVELLCISHEGPQAAVVLRLVSAGLGASGILARACALRRAGIWCCAQGTACSLHIRVHAVSALLWKSSGARITWKRLNITVCQADPRTWRSAREPRNRLKDPVSPCGNGEWSRVLCSRWLDSCAKPFLC